MMDKAKSLLVYYSNRFLNGSLDDQINDAFGVAFVTYDRLREFVLDEGFRINNISRDTFSEDDLLRYHYLSYEYPSIVNGMDYDASSRTVYEGFLKKTLKGFAEVGKQKLKDFIADYINDVSTFSKSFDELIPSMHTQSTLL
ncbi:MAG: hypothetical protein U5P10_07940 [Spirochaetia bacterium]|nr:hypothetical protein [Spirochaetia bacterium]